MLFLESAHVVGDCMATDKYAPWEDPEFKKTVHQKVKNAFVDECKEFMSQCTAVLVWVMAALAGLFAFFAGSYAICWFFQKGAVTVDAYFTVVIIVGVSLLGILGVTMGIKGRYARLRHMAVRENYLKVIVPKGIEEVTRIMRNDGYPPDDECLKIIQSHFALYDCMQGIIDWDEQIQRVAAIGILFMKKKK